MQSEYLSPSQLRVINRIGDIIIPGDGTLPKFSECGFVAHIDSILTYLPPAHVKDLRAVTAVFRFLPDCFIRGFLRLTGRAGIFPNFIAMQLRKAEFGLKGITCTLYYVCLDDEAGYGRKIKDTIGWDAAVRTEAPEDDLSSLVASANPLT